MSRREDIDNGIWGDPDFARLPALAKAAYIWTFTNSHCGMSGLYKLRPGTLAFELGIDPDHESQLWAELDAADFATFAAGVVLVRTRVKHLRTRGQNMAKSIATDVAKIDPAHPLRIRFLEIYGREPWLLEHGLLEPLLNPSGTLPTSHEQAESSDPSRTSGGVAGLGHGSGLGQWQGNGQVGEERRESGTAAGASWS